jgi:hypothetical protein
MNNNEAKTSNSVKESLTANHIQDDKFQSNM